jgi:hypothetical protein
MRRSSDGREGGQMSDLKQTVRLLRPASASSGEGGPSADGPVEETELELVSTAMLRAMLDSGNADHQRRLREAAAGKQGVLAKNLGSGNFEIIDDEDLKTALAAAATDRAAKVSAKPLLERADKGDEKLSLVSTQALRQMLGQVEKEPAKKDKATPKTPGGGFDPYNSA